MRSGEEHENALGRPSEPPVEPDRRPGLPAAPEDIRLPRVTIGLVAWNSLSSVTDLVTAIRGLTSAPYELVVVDNHSTDGTLEYLKQFQGEPGFVLVENRTNLQ